LADLTPYLEELLRLRGSDLHLKVGAAPHVRVNGRLVPLPSAPLLASDLEAVTLAAVPPHRHRDLTDSGDIDFALGIAGLGRFRVHALRQRGSYGLVVRHVPPGIPAWDQLGLPDGVRRLAESTSGLIVLASPAGSGKTTTAASLLDYVNETRTASIATIEDPIEFLHRDKHSIVSQREVGSDTPSFAAAMASVGRLDADVILLSDLPDAPTVEAALAAASTGRLVLATMPTATVAATIARLIEMFPLAHRLVARQLLSLGLRGVVCQRLLERSDSAGRTPAVEILVSTPRSSELLASPDGSVADLERLMAEGHYYGMQTLDQSLIGLCRDGLVGVQEVLAAASSPEEMRTSLFASGVRLA
jgi:twitching motility protein PilT